MSHQPTNSFNGGGGAELNGYERDLEQVGEDELIEEKHLA